MINDQPVFINEEHEIVSAPPVVNQIFPISLGSWLWSSFPPLALINSEIPSHLDIISDRIGLSKTPDNDLPGERRMSKLRP
jgi:hypothetical protein